MSILNEYVTVYKDDDIEISDNKLIKNIKVNDVIYNYGRSRSLDNTMDLLKDDIAELSMSTGLTEYEVCKRISLVLVCWMSSLMKDIEAVYEFKSDFIEVKNNKVTLFNTVDLDNCKLDNNYGIKETLEKLGNEYNNYFGLLLDIVTELDILFLSKDQLISGSIHTIYGDICPGDCIKFRGHIKKIHNMQVDIYSNAVIIKFELDKRNYITTISELCDGVRITKEQVEETNNLVAMLGTASYNIKY